MDVIFHEESKSIHSQKACLIISIVETHVSIGWPMEQCKQL